MLLVSYFAITMMNVAFYETIMTVVLYSSKGRYGYFSKASIDK